METGKDKVERDRLTRKLRVLQEMIEEISSIIEYEAFFVDVIDKQELTDMLRLTRDGTYDWSNKEIELVVEMFFIITEEGA